MPRLNSTKVDQKGLERIGKRHLAGETAEALAKEFKVSRASIFNYSLRYKRGLLEQTRRDGLSKANVERLEKADLVTTIKALSLENRQLKKKLVALMLKNSKKRPRSR